MTTKVDLEKLNNEKMDNILNSMCEIVDLKNYNESIKIIKSELEEYKNIECIKNYINYSNYQDPIMQEFLRLYLTNGITFITTMIVFDVGVFIKINDIILKTIASSLPFLIILCCMLFYANKTNWKYARYKIILDAIEQKIGKNAA